MYIYESHMGGLYATEEELDYDFLYCEECGDTDWLVGEAYTKEEAYALLKDDIDHDGEGGWDPDYLDSFLEEYFGEQEELEDTEPGGKPEQA